MGKMLGIFNVGKKIGLNSLTLGKQISHWASKTNKTTDSNTVWPYYFSHFYLSLTIGFIFSLWRLCLSCTSCETQLLRVPEFYISPHCRETLSITFSEKNLAKRLSLAWARCLALSKSTKAKGKGTHLRSRAFCELLWGVRKYLLLVEP